MIARAIELIKKEPSGIRIQDIMEKFRREFGEAELKNVIRRLKKHPDVYQPEKGLLRYIKFKRKYVQKNFTLYLNPKALQALRPFFRGIAIKTAGYLMITAGIFGKFVGSNWLIGDIALILSLTGIVFVVTGWMLIYRAFKKSAE